jgi:Zn-finger nucleic acid-binding protein
MNRQEIEYRRKGTLVLYQCAKCSGIWVDRDAVIQLTHASALKPDTALELKDMQTQPRRFALTCPRCAKLLTESAGGKLPPGLHIDYCNACYGLWFDKGELAAYKRGAAGRNRENIANNDCPPLFILIEVIADILTIFLF